MTDFRTLSPLDFEELVRDLLQAEFGLRFESFGPGPDLGIDFRFSIAKGKAVVQVKHYLDSGVDGLLRAARGENAKVAKLKPERYIFVTSVSLTPLAKSRVKDSLSAAPLADDDILGRADLNNLLGRHPEVEKKHFKLWLASTAVLERILHSGVYNRTQAELEVIRAVVPKFVQNESVPRAEAILQKNGALIIAGEPGVGKSTLARMLVWLHAEQGWNISVIDDIKEAFEVAHEGERRLVLFDDFLGQVHLSNDLIRGMDQRFPPFLQKVRANKNLRFILTTRDYILHQAQAQSSRLSTAAVNASEFVLDVGTYTRTVRAKILFNHLYFSDISVAERNALLAEDFYLRIIDHKNFNPRLVELLTSAEYVSLAGTPICKTVAAVLANPQELWEKPYRTHISDEGRALMLAVYFNDARPTVVALERAFDRMTVAMGLKFPQIDLPAKFRYALKELEGSIIAIQDRQVRFANPGIRDFLQRVVRDDRLIPIAIEAVREYAEVKQAWQVFSEELPGLRHGDPTLPAWAAAAARLMEHASGSELQRLDLLMDMHNELNGDILLPLIDRAVRDLERAGIDETQADLCSQTLESVVMSLLPSDLLDDTRKVLSDVIAKMLSEFGDALTLDEIRSIGNSLFESGVDQDAAAGAVRTALSGYIGEMSSTLSEVTSLRELDELESELNTMMNDFGVSDGRATRRIESRREELMEKEESGSGSYSGRSAGITGHVSDDQIRSMFNGLRTL